MNSKFKLNSNGTYGYNWKEEDLLDIANDWLSNISKTSKAERCSHDNNYITFEVYRGLNHPEYDDSDYNMLEHDTVYTDWEGTYYNFSDDYIMWVKVDDLKSERIEVLYLPLIYKNLDIHYNKDIDKHLFDLSVITISTFIEDDTLHRLTMELYFEDFRGLSFDDHCKNKYEMMEYKYNYIKSLEIESQE